MEIKRSIIQTFVALLGLCCLSQAEAQINQIEVVVDGLVAIPRGELNSFDYMPGSRELRLNSVHRDFRCAAAEPENTPPPGDGDFKLVLDQVNPATEPEAVYAVSTTAGIVAVNLANGVLEIITTDKNLEKLECAPLRDSFWASDFGNLIGLESSAPEFAEAGTTFTITLTVTNGSKSIMATNVQVTLNSSIDPDKYALLDAGGSELLVSPQITGNEWTIPSLWPLESVTLEATYTAPLDGSGVTLEIVDATADSRDGSQPLATGNPSLVTVVNTGT